MLSTLAETIKNHLCDLPGHMNWAITEHPDVKRDVNPCPDTTAKTIPWMAIPKAKIKGNVSAGCIDFMQNFLEQCQLWLSTSIHHTYDALYFGLHLLDDQ